MLPTNRQLKRLGDYIEFQNGFAFKSNEYKSEGFFVMRIKNVQNGYISLDDPQYISSDKGIDFSKFILQEGDILMSLTGNIGRIGVIKNEHLPAVLNQRVARLKIGNDINKNYIFYFLRRSDFQDEIMSKASGAAQKNISTKDISQVEIPLPPLATQTRIVAKLDQTSAQITQAKEQINTQLSALDELWQSSLSEVFENEEYEKVKLNDITKIQSFNFLPGDDEIYNYIGLENIESNTGKLIDFSPTLGKKIKSHKVKFEKGMILYGKLRPYLNKVHLAEFDGIATTEILPMKIKEGILGKYIELFLRSKKFVDEANASVSGARMPRVTTRFLQEYDQIPLPDLATQTAIVSHLDKLSQQILSLRSQYTAQLQYYDELRESILDKAFKGELVA